MVEIQGTLLLALASYLCSISLPSTWYYVIYLNKFPFVKHLWLILAINCGLTISFLQKGLVLLLQWQSASMATARYCHFWEMYPNSFTLTRISSSFTSPFTSCSGFQHIYSWKLLVSCPYPVPSVYQLLSDFSLLCYLWITRSVISVFLEMPSVVSSPCFLPLLSHPASWSSSVVSSGGF